MHHIFYSESVVKQFLVQNGPLYKRIMDENPELLQLVPEKRYILIYTKYIEGTVLEEAYAEFYQQYYFEQSRLNGTYQYESEVVKDLDKLIRKFGWSMFMHALISLVDRRRQNSLDQQTRGSWVRILDKLSSMNKTIKYS